MENKGQEQSGPMKPEDWDRSSKLVARCLALVGCPDHSGLDARLWVGGSGDSVGWILGLWDGGSG